MFCLNYKMQREYADQLTIIKPFNPRMTTLNSKLKLYRNSIDE